MTEYKKNILMLNIRIQNGHQQQVAANIKINPFRVK